MFVLSVLPACAVVSLSVSPACYYRRYSRLSWVPEGLGLLMRTLEDC